MTPRQKLVLIFLLALLGFADAGWLTAQSLLSAPARVCGPVGDCQQVFSSSYAHLFGVPLSVFGLLMYTSLLVIAYAAASLPDTKRPVLFLRVLAAVGALFSAALMYVQFFVLHAFCLFCTLSAFIVILIWVLSLWLPKERVPGEPAVRTGGRVTAYALSMMVLLLYAGFVIVVAGGRAPSSGVVARIGEEVITEQELNDGIRTFASENQRQLHEAKMQWVDEALAVRLLKKEAEKRRISVASLEDQAIGKIPPVADSEIVALARKWKLDVKVLTDIDRRYLHSVLYDERRSARRKKFVDSLKKSYDVAILLQKPLPAHADFDFTGSPRSGSDQARVTLVVFMDFECQPCAEVAKHVDKLRDSYGDSLRIIVKNLPLDSHPHAALAAEGALCANEQGRFWAYHDLLFANQGRLGREMLLSYAEQVGMDVARFRESLESGRYRPLVERDQKEAERIGVGGTPTVFINGEPMAGELSLEGLRQVITAAMTPR